MKVSRQSPVAIHIQIADHFRAAIQAGYLPTGNMLPSELVIANEHDISRSTVRKAMDILVTEGWVKRYPGKGTFVRELENDTLAFIGVVLPSTRDMLSVDILVGVEQAAKQDNCHVIFAQTNEDLEQERHDVESMRNQKVAGLVLFPASGITEDSVIETLLADNVPLVLVDRYIPGLSTDAVIVDNVKGGYEAANHLIALGHKHIGFIASSSMQTTSVHDRFTGFRQALNEHDLTFDNADLIVYDGHNATLEDYLCRIDVPSAIFASNDYTAIDLINAARKCDIHVPRDLAVVGFDDTDAASRLDVPLTTVAQSGQQVGQSAYQLLKDQIDGIKRSPKHEIIPVNLIIRQSCGAEA